MIFGKLKYLIVKLLGLDEKSKRRLFIKLSVLFGIFAFLIILARSWNSGQLVQEITVEGNKNLSAKEIIELVDKYALNRSKSDIDFAGMKRILESDPYILSAAVKNDGVKEVRIIVKEREPKAMVHDRGGDLRMVGEDGGIMPYRLLGGISNLPIISGVTNYGQVDTSAIRGAVKIIGELNSESNKPLDNLVSEVCFDWQSRTFSIITTYQGINVLIGRAENLSHKVSNFKRFWLEDFRLLKDLGKRNIDIRWNSRVILS